MTRKSEINALFFKNNALQRTENGNALGHVFENNGKSENNALNALSSALLPHWACKINGLGVARARARVYVISLQDIWLRVAAYKRLASPTHCGTRRRSRWVVLAGELA